MKQNITLKVDCEIYKKYRKYTKDKGIIISRMFELDAIKRMKNGK